ncbi:MOSC domain-containing protein [uncultured Roseobacter sp.]|uniref:MOSC domain-containing protein n=1 Tax=uncultured Roseobacter sp. TaxID=114847 RepID=UPI002626E98D|nr:MOSC domain-containing protein [uncultured Roseobacter sp.]
MPACTLTRLSRYPVKGLSAEALQTVTLHPGDGLPGDRLYGFARYNAGFDPTAPRPLPKDRFVVLLTQAALAGLQTRFDPQTLTLTWVTGGHRATFDMATAEGRAEAAATLHRLLDLADPEPPVFVSAAPHRFTDVSVVSPQMMNAVSVLNLASVRALEERWETPVHPARFRANIEIDGLPAFAELDSIGATLRFGDAELRLLSRTKRCAATEVNPETAERDLKLPYQLRRDLGHMDMGVYAEVVTGGTLAVGQTGQLTA